MNISTKFFHARLIALLLGLLSPTLAFLAVEIIKLVVADVDYLGVGTTAATFRFALGVCVCYRFARETFCIWDENWAGVPWWYYGREIRNWFVLLPIAILFGRTLFTHIPPWDPFVGCILALFTIYFLKDFRFTSQNTAQTEFRRGAKQLSNADAESKAAGFPQGPDPPIQWAGLQLPSNLKGHFCVVGGTGAGKTLMIRGLMASILPHILPGTDRRAIVYDVKLDTISHLSDMGISCPIVNLNPFDTRSWAWDISNDLKDPGTADQYAGILFPSEEGDDKNKYFAQAAQALVGGVLKAFIISRKQWSLRDLIHVTGSEERLRAVLLSSKYTRDRVSRYFEPKDTFKNILSTISNVMVKLERVAAVWERTPTERHISLNTWCREKGSILVLGRQFDRSETLTLLNQIVFRRISELLLSGDESPSRWKTWLFLDELQEAGKLDGLRQLLNDGRSKGVRMALGFQDIEGLRVTYGEHLANTLPAMCANLSILHLSSSFTAQWASDQLGEVENFEYVTSFGTSRDKDGNVTTSNNVTKNIEARRSLLPSEFLSFAQSDGGYVFGCHDIPQLGGFVARSTRYPFHEPRAKENFSERTDFEEMLLPPWTKEDAERMGIPFTEEEYVQQNITVTKEAAISSLDRFKRVTRPSD